ncbi:MAG: sugar phosphate isomerase/epimerase [bacterium]|nr:sugar phosphate isomerase/epimerase [bacterium]
MRERVFFNAPLPFIFANEALLDRHPVNAELFLDGDGLETLDEAQVARARRIMDSRGLRRRVHGPISEMALGAFDPRVRAVTVDRFAQAIDFASGVAADAVVIHSGFDSVSKRGLEARYLEGMVPPLRLLARRAAERGIRLLVENTFEPSPDLLLEALAGAASESVGLCFDIAHHRLFGRTAVEEWIGRCAARIEEVHVTDNGGQWDEHLAPGEGGIDFETVFRLLREHAVRPVFTFEPHDVQAFIACLEYIDRHAGRFT